MKLTIFNGSPRGTKSNTKILTDHFLNGLKSTNKEIETDTAYLVRTNEMETYNEMFQSSDIVIMAFPLYTDAMPGIVKHFIEHLEPFCGKFPNKKIGFIVQSGFPETIHSRFVEKYLEKLAKRLCCQYLGTIIKGGVEGIQVQPPRMTNKLFQYFYDLGKDFGKTNEFNEQIKKQLGKMETLPKAAIIFIKVLSKTPLMHFYWNRMLKKNKAYKNRFDQPYKR